MTGWDPWAPGAGSRPRAPAEADLGGRNAPCQACEPGRLLPVAPGERRAPEDPAGLRRSERLVSVLSRRVWGGSSLRGRQVAGTDTTGSAKPWPGPGPGFRPTCGASTGPAPAGRGWARRADCPRFAPAILPSAPGPAQGSRTPGSRRTPPAGGRPARGSVHPGGERSRPCIRDPGVGPTGHSWKRGLRAGPAPLPFPGISGRGGLAGDTDAQEPRRSHRSFTSGLWGRTLCGVLSPAGRFSAERLLLPAARPGQPAFDL